MTIEYKIEEQDFLDFQLFTASKSDRINKKKRNGWVLCDSTESAKNHWNIDPECRG